MSVSHGGKKFPSPIPNPAASNPSTSELSKTKIPSPTLIQTAKRPGPASLPGQKPTTRAPSPGEPPPVPPTFDDTQESTLTDTLRPLHLVDTEEKDIGDEIRHSLPEPDSEIPQVESGLVKIGISLGRLDPFLTDPAVTEIMVNDIRNIVIEKQGKLWHAQHPFRTLEELQNVVQSILLITGKSLNPDHPYLDTMLPDGSRVNIVIPPLTLVGPCLTIRKFPSQNFSAQDLIQFGTFDQRIAYFLNCCVVARLNILVSGGTGSGKTTLLNVLSTFIPKNERVITIEDTPELALQHPNSVRLQTKPRTPESEGISTRDLLANCLRMRPDRIVIGECRRGEAFDMLQAMNTGHDGSMSTIHANSVRDSLSRLETLCLSAGLEVPVPIIRKQVSNALDLLIQVQRFRSGKRRVIQVSEITGMEGDVITLQDIFRYEPAPILPGQPPTTEAGKFKPTGFIPTCLEKLRNAGIELPANYFQAILGLLLAFFTTSCELTPEGQRVFNWARRQISPSPIAEVSPKSTSSAPSGELEDPIANKASRAEANAEILKEMVEVITLRPPADRSEFGNWVDSLNQGASIEGVHNGLTHSSDYRQLEQANPGASAKAVQIFAEEMAYLDQEFDLMDSADSSPGEGPKSATFQKRTAEYVKAHVSSSIFTLKKTLADHALAKIQSKNEFKEKLAHWYAKWAVRLTTRKVDFGLALRNNSDEAFHYHWATKTKLDRIRWEVLNRIHRLLNDANKNKQ